MMNLQDITKKLSDATTALAKADNDLKLEIANAAADAAGIIDPTPASDIVGAGLSIARGDYWGAALSTVSFIPYLGDAVAKPAKAVRATKAIMALEKKVAGLTQTVADLTKAKKQAEAAEAAAKEAKIAEEAEAARDAAAKQEKSAAKKGKDCEDCALEGKKTASAPAKVATNYGNIPPEHRWRYDRYLQGKAAKKLAPDEWYAAAKRAWSNNSSGNAFEQAVRKELGAPLGAGSKPISIEGYVPDLPIGLEYGVTDVKNVVKLSNSDQLRAFAQHASDNGLPFNSIIGPRTESISEPLLDSIRRSGGNVIRYDPLTREFTNIDIGLTGPWKK
ncbi:hypothetical protein ASD15_31425 [Massilia sp. Root351]|jgi:23S rRNA maturation mini-RNase III|uniref:putative toxin n=1 Tax=Massilia sp. Root351 TaxID=1736522 RepID=UPI00070C2B3E|nr:putative toxin [Massilia sp. Root351]KQV81847.1 hypothetical protein ASD15_31425 [Massilia sp. Root351]